MKGLDGKVAIVTGGGSGLGEAISKRLASSGVRVVVSDINKQGADRVVQEILTAKGTASAIVHDTAKPEDNEKVVSHAMSTYGALHYAVNNAGIGGKQAPAGDVDITDWNRVIDINLNGVLYGMRYQIPAMIKSGAKKSAIVNMASIHGAVAAIGNAAYTAAKHGVVGLTKNAAAEYGPQGLRINCVGPAYIETPLLANLPGDQDCAHRQASVGQAGEARRGCAARLLPVVGRSVVHDRRLLPGGRRIHRGLTDRVFPGALRCERRRLLYSSSVCASGAH